MTKISFLLPTRNRPLLVKRFLDGLVDNTTNLDSIEVVLYIDDDDTVSHNIEDNRLKLEKIIGPRVSMGRLNSACFEKSEGDVIILANDDMVIQTPGWDQTIIELHKKMTDEVYLAYGNDLDMNQTLCPFPIMPRKACEILAIPFPAEYAGGYIDYHILDIFKRLEKMGFDRIFYYDNLVFEHLHYQTGKSKLDATYQDRGPIDRGDEVFIAFREVRHILASRLAAAIRGEESLKTPVPNISLGNPPKLLRGIAESFTKFALDSRLPAWWRFDLFILFTTRSLARANVMPGKGYMRRFLKLIGWRRVPWARNGE